MHRMHADGYVEIGLTLATAIVVSNWGYRDTSQRVKGTTAAAGGRSRRDNRHRRRLEPKDKGRRRRPEPNEQQAPQATTAKRIRSSQAVGPKEQKALQGTRFQRSPASSLVQRNNGRRRRLDPKDQRPQAARSKGFMSRKLADEA